MHSIEPYFNWRHLYIAEDDPRSPFFGTQHSEFEFTQKVYNYYIHPQWDDVGSQTLYLKVLFVEYDAGYAIIEFIGEWNDAIENDVMVLKRELIDKMLNLGISKYILITENVLNFHSSDECYYEEWCEDVSENGGWVVVLGMPSQSMHDIKRAGIDRFFHFIDLTEWRPYSPSDLFTKLDNYILKKLNNFQ